MRRIIVLEDALFTKKPDDSAWQNIQLPHTWNNFDGQDGGADYDRGEYRYKIKLPQKNEGMRQFIQFEAANHIATVWCGKKLLGKHEGGFSTFRFEVTEAMQNGEEQILVAVDNSESHVYPQQADFTFFGGLYRPVCFIEVPNSHFDLMKHGSSGVFITPRANGEVRVDAFVENVMAGSKVVCRILDEKENVVAEMQTKAGTHTVLTGKVDSPHLWNGLEGAYCYTAELLLYNGNVVEDTIKEIFGFRSFEVKPDAGFYLNGEKYPLHGVSRHQDRQDMGWALTEKEHSEDLALIKEVGANTIRLAHYQHSQYFYSLCDKSGMVLWAEIPFITMFIEGEDARKNTISQMTELIVQNYNHPSIFFWGISNEISIGGETPELLANLKELNSLAKKLDPSRLTTMAQVSMLDIESEQNQITDILSYNHYFGWYSGEVSENGPWLDEFHEKYPDRALGVSEYGAEGITKWHSENPEVQDYTEEYQALYHEEMLKTFAERPYLWSTHVWNMFDFAADARDEGGSKGRNNKGLVTYDRKIKKDSFFAYKAFWTKEAFVHICGRRFVNRAPEQRNIKVYSNCPTVTLYVNGQEFASKTADKIFIFENVPLNAGENKIMAKTNAAIEDIIILNGVEKPDENYILPQDDNGTDGVANWFNGLESSGGLEFKDGYFSIKDTIGDIMENQKANEALQEMMTSMAGGVNAKSMKNMMGMIKNMSLEKILKMSGKRAPADAKYIINDILNKIKK